MKRRTFLKGALAGAAAAAAVGAGGCMLQSMAQSPEPTIAPEGASPAGTGPVLSVVEGADWAGLVKSVLAPLGGIAAFVQPGMKVVVKPNIGWDRTPEQGANTHPDVVRALIVEALAAGAAEVLVFDNSCAEARRCYKQSGIQDAVEGLGDPRARIEFVDGRKFVQVKLEGTKSLKQAEFYKPALEADCYINVPVAKQHGSSGLTLGLKNTMGTISNRGAIHRDIGQRIAELNTAIRPKLTVIDATRIMLRSGPTGGSLDDVRVMNTLIASADPIACDAYATTLFGKLPHDLRSTVAGYELGLGEMDLAKIRLTKA